MLKYIILREGDSSLEVAAFCLAPITHRELALALQAHRHGRTIVAAGFVEFNGSEARIYGRSESLDLGPRPGDAAFLTTFARLTATAAAASLNQIPTAAHV